MEGIIADTCRFQEEAESTPMAEERKSLSPKKMSMLPQIMLMTRSSRGVRHRLKIDTSEAILRNQRHDAHPAPMMKFVCAVTEPYGIKTIVSLNPIMIDGTGMCGGCRVVVDGKTQFACVDGPEFDGHLVDWDELIKRNSFYKEEEAAHLCRLTGGMRHG